MEISDATIEKVPHSTPERMDPSAYKTPPHVSTIQPTKNHDNTKNNNNKQTSNKHQTPNTTNCNTNNVSIYPYLTTSIPTLTLSPETNHAQPNQPRIIALKNLARHFKAK